MNFKSHTIVVIFIGLLMSLTSCVKDSEFSSADNKLPTQSIDFDLIISSLEAIDFMITSEQKDIIMLTDTILLEDMNTEFFLGELTKTQLSFKFINTINRDFKVDFEFINDDHMLIHDVHVPVSSGSFDTPVVVEAIVTIKEPELISFRDASKLVYKITLPPSKQPLNPAMEGKISLMSKSTNFYDM